MCAKVLQSFRPQQGMTPQFPHHTSSCVPPSPSSYGYIREDAAAPKAASFTPLRAVLLLRGGVDWAAGDIQAMFNQFCKDLRIGKIRQTVKGQALRMLGLLVKHFPQHLLDAQGATAGTAGPTIQVRISR